MELDSLQALITLLRQNGVVTYRSSDLELVLGAVPVRSGEEKTVETREEVVDEALSKLPEAYRAAFTASPLSGVSQ